MDLFTVPNRPYDANMERAARNVIAFGFAALGVHHFIYLDFVTRIVPPLPSWIPWHPFWAVVTGVVLIAGAIGMAMEERIAAVAIGCGCIVTFVLLWLPSIAMNPLRGAGALVGPWKDLVLAGTAFLVAASLTSADQAAVRERLVLMSKYFLGGFMILCGYLHFTEDVSVASLIPPWIPWHFFWTYFAGVALIAGGAGMTIPKTTQLASLLSGIMILAWVPLVHIPLALQNLHDPGQSVPVCEALSFGTAALLAYRLGVVRAPQRHLAAVPVEA